MVGEEREGAANSGRSGGGGVPFPPLRGGKGIEGLRGVT